MFLWKPYFPMERKKREEYLGWAKTIAYSRADAIVSGQHRRQYRQVAVLLAMVAEIEESMGMPGQRGISTRISKQNSHGIRPSRRR